MAATIWMAIFSHPRACWVFYQIRLHPTELQVTSGEWKFKIGAPHIHSHRFSVSCTWTQYCYMLNPSCWKWDDIVLFVFTYLIDFIFLTQLNVFCYFNYICQISPQIKNKIRKKIIYQHDTSRPIQHIFRLYVWSKYLDQIQTKQAELRKWYWFLCIWKGCGRS